MVATIAGESGERLGAPVVPKAVQPQVPRGTPAWRPGKQEENRHSVCAKGSIEILPQQKRAESGSWVVDALPVHPGSHSWSLDLWDSKLKSVGRCS